ncbi:MAG: alpha/beta fold hydrolase [Panacagrimonas sp.]
MSSPTTPPQNPHALRPIALRGFDGIRLAGDEAGDRAAPPVILLHGGGQTRHAWAGTAEHLARAGYYALTYDARGHGDSAWSESGDYRADAFAADLRCVLQTLSAPPVLIGASMGGMTSLIVLGETHEVLARGLVLVDIAVRLESDGVARILNFMRGHPDGFATLEDAAEAVYQYNPHRKRAGSTQGLRKNLRLRDNGRWYWHWDPRYLDEANRVVDGEALTLETRRIQAARGVRVPTLLVRGAQSDVLSLEGARALLELIPQAELVDVAEAGHMVAGDRNDVFGEAVIDFLARHVPAPGA